MNLKIGVEPIICVVVVMIMVSSYGVILILTGLKKACILKWGA
ncbi:hypothetical protein HBZC1_02650 [Helicobacter bizzozeronii CIII-1]|uniref:Uncharacterized protein n=1 Tax=Helicobacter bizzozeronii (strain CIII-1) TaxID=1002804 RepID=F8KR77_HELBC|nr:hypothetical protein HBZC1_02650 [Helicobacter bizzozeronii CIII-1]